MLPDKSLLLEQINSAIKRNSCKRSAESIAYLAKNEPLGINREIPETIFLRCARNSEAIKKLEQRIEALESQNDNLLYFIHFLYKNFPDLVKDTLPGGNCEAFDKDINEVSGQFRLVVKNNFPSLTRREIEILHLLVKGLCAKEIASALFISETTVITHKKHLKEKFNAKNTVELISKACAVFVSTGIPAAKNF